MIFEGGDHGLTEFQSEVGWSLVRSPSAALAEEGVQVGPPHRSANRLDSWVCSKGGRQVAIESGQQLLHYRLIEKIGEGGMG